MTDIPVSGDYDGDGNADVTIYRNGLWFILRSSDGEQTAVSWGGATQDVPVPADYDGDGKIDQAVYRDGAWLIRRSLDGGTTFVSWGGLAEGMVVPRDYDGDGKADLAVYRDGTWFIIRSSDGGFTINSWGGLAHDIPVPADYDGDGRADISVYRNGLWFILRSSDGGQTTSASGRTGPGRTTELMPYFRSRIASSAETAESRPDRTLSLFSSLPSLTFNNLRRPLKFRQFSKYSPGALQSAAFLKASPLDMLVNSNTCHEIAQQARRLIFMQNFCGWSLFSCV